jgi:hypothetical protein
MSGCNVILETIFPELKESEGEQSKNWVLEYLHDGLRKSDEQFKDQFKCAIAWLEKQGEQKPAFEMKTPEESLGIDSDTYNEIVDDCLFGEQKPTDKVKPKFSIGDKIQYSKGCGTIMTIEKIENGEYIFGNNMGHTTIENGNKWYLVSHVEQNTAWSEENEKMLDFAIRAVGLCKQYAINHQVNGYSKLPDVPKRYEELQDWLKSIKNRVQPKQEWSEEDEMKLNEALGVIAATDYYTLNDKKEIENWLKSLKDRILPKTEWSEEDKETINRATSAIYSLSNVVESKQEDEELSELADKLQELIKPQKQWKPNKAQLKALHDLNLTGNLSCVGQGQVLIELYNDLKELTK